MNGTIFNEFEKFGKATLGEEPWRQVVASAGLSRNIYLPITEYPDSELLALASAISATTGIAVPVILRQFGEFIAAHLINMAQHIIDPAWKTIELIANTESAIHSVYRGSKTHIRPPELNCRKVSDKEVVVTYTSSRKLCPFAKGVIRGISKYFMENVVISENRCMLKGDGACEIVVLVV